MALSYIDIAAQLIDGSTRIDPDRVGEPEQIADEIIASLSLTRLREYVLLHMVLDRAGDNGECDSNAMGAVTIAHRDSTLSREK